jgi:hypothetical protein
MRKPLIERSYIFSLNFRWSTSILFEEFLLLKNTLIFTISEGTKDFNSCSFMRKT